VKGKVALALSRLSPLSDAIPGACTGLVARFLLAKAKSIKSSNYTWRILE
jgi:hypothetical protein